MQPSSEAPEPRGILQETAQSEGAWPLSSRTGGSARPVGTRQALAPYLHKTHMPQALHLKTLAYHKCQHHKVPYLLFLGDLGFWITCVSKASQ